MLKTALNKIIRWAVNDAPPAPERIYDETSSRNAILAKDSVNVQIIRAVNGHIVSVRVGDRGPYIDKPNYPEIYVGTDDDVMKTVATAIVAARLEK